jgi:hypothetical protein
MVEGHLRNGLRATARRALRIVRGAFGPNGIDVAAAGLSVVAAVLCSACALSGAAVVPGSFPYTGTASLETSGSPSAELAHQTANLTVCAYPAELAILSIGPRCTILWTDRVLAAGPTSPECTLAFGATEHHLHVTDADFPYSVRYGGWRPRDLNIGADDVETGLHVRFRLGVPLDASSDRVIRSSGGEPPLLCPKLPPPPLEDDPWSREDEERASRK